VFTSFQFRQDAILRRFAAFCRIERYCGVLKAKMTIARRTAFFFMVLMGISHINASHAQHYRMSEDIISDPMTGAALMGYDPVSYFLHQEARAGDPSIPLQFGGKIWHFTSEGNRHAFESNPHAYVPGFGGYDPISISRGVAVAGSPKIYAIHDGRLYFFRRAENRDSFLSSDALIEDAARNWPEVKRNLIP
jgi:hypothetical protein